MAFWGTDLSSNTSGDPKRKFRWKVQIGNIGDGTGVIWYAKTVTKPEMTVGDLEHKFFGHTFKFPGSVTWNDLEITLVDPVSPDAAKQTLSIMHEAGYRFPEAGYQNPDAGGLTSISKDKAVDALKPFIISQLDAEGEVIERWELHNPFLTKVGFGDLSYDADELSEISLSVKYDWAKWSAGANKTSTIFTDKYDV